MVKLFLVMWAVFSLVIWQPQPTPVHIEGTDGHVLQADYYPGSSGRAVLLLHQLYTDRTSWHNLIPLLQANGYAVLAPDLRGYGQTGGAIDWREAQRDTRLWLEWLGQENAQVAVIGSSMGANLAVLGCADVGCVTVVAVSPGLNYYGYTPLKPALSGGLAERPVLFISSQRDGYPARAVKELSSEFDTIEAIWIDGNAHGMDLLSEPITNDIVIWLNAQFKTSHS